MIWFCGGPGRDFLRREITREADGRFWTQKIPQPLARGEGGHTQTSSSFPSSGFWRNRCLRPRTQDLMSANKQVFWLRGHPTLLALPTMESVAFFSISSLRYSGATARDLHPLPYSPQLLYRGTCLCFPTNYWWSTQRTTLLVAVHISLRQAQLQKNFPKTAVSLDVDTISIAWSWRRRIPYPFPQ